MDIPNKAGLRAQLRASRASLDSSLRRAAGAQLARTTLAWLGTFPAGIAAFDGAAPATADGAGPGPAVCAYLSVGKEPSTGPLLEALFNAGYRVLVPVCEPDFRLSWVYWSPGADVVPSQLAPVMEPTGTRQDYADIGRVLAVLVPALAVDSGGSRLGQGGGYYDRFLSSLATGAAADPGSPTLVAAVVYDSEFLVRGTVPVDSLDMPVRFAITPLAVHPLSND